MCWPWRKNTQAGQAHDLARAAAEAASAADQARRSAERASAAAEAVLGALSRARPSGRSVLVAVAATMVLLVAGCLAMLLGSQGLRSPVNGGPDRPSDVRVAVEDSDRRSPSATVGIIHDVEPSIGDGLHTYRIVFPTSDIGQQFAVLFHGGAVLERPTANVDVEVRSVDCPDGLRGSLTEETCQLITGTVPSAREVGPGVGGYSCEFSSDSGLIGGVTVELDGFADVLRNVDWAHGIVELPSVSASSVAAEELSFDPGSTVAQTCRYLRKPSGTVSDLFIPTDGESLQWLFWETPNGAGLNHMTVTYGDAESNGNLLLAVGGVIAGVGVGMVPVSARRVQDWMRPSPGSGTGRL